jgi:hypothetical protein
MLLDKKILMALRLLILALLAQLLTSCSAAILSVGEEEYSVIHWGSKKGQIESHLGAPIESLKLVPPMSVADIGRKFDHVDLLGFPAVKNDKGDPRVTYPEVPAATQEKYSYTGRIQRKHDVGEAIALAGYTWGLSELIMVPAAIKMQADRSNQAHIVVVWYDKSNTALAYQWITTQE